MGAACCKECVDFSPRIQTHLDVFFAILETTQGTENNGRHVTAVAA